MAKVPSPADFEKLGAFYLGRTAETEDLLLYDAKDLTTHAVCVGMTGSGKTGLCLGLLEEAAIDGIPAIAIDPKGDLGNLLLTFPELRPADFRPWIDEGVATRKGLTPDAYAVQTAEQWREGLRAWGQDGARIGRLREAADLAIYTPGSDAGLPLTVLRSFAAPPAALRDDADAFRERITSAVAGLLALLGIDPDPVRSREHILLSTVLDRAWREGRDLDVAGLIQAIQSPPFDRIGVMDLEAVYPAKDRFALAMALNNLIASPGFRSWLEGEPLDVSKLLWTETGKPRVSILSIAHLSEAERMFFVTLLLNEVVAWMRGQPGTTSLRALLYMDEIFGYFPPTANPPSKRPMLTLLKQARAYGLGVVLATQNPVDLDYKGLSNTGTWFLGRLQTERDVERVVDGLAGATAASGAPFDRGAMERTLAGLRSRRFLMNNVHENAPVLFDTRWVLSYLRGPLTRTQIAELTAARKAPEPSPTPPPPAAAVAATPVAAAPVPAERPVVAAGVPEHFLAPTRRAPGSARMLYRPALLGTAELHYANASLGLDDWRNVACLAPLDAATGDVWEGAVALERVPDLHSRPEPDAAFAELPGPAARASSYAGWEKRFRTHVYRAYPMQFWTCGSPKVSSKPGETRREFEIRLREELRSARDLEVEKLRKKYAPKLATLQDRLRRAQERVEREEAQYGQSKMSTAISVGQTILGALFGRKAVSAGTIGRAGTSVARAGRAAKEKDDIRLAKQNAAEAKRKLEQLEKDFQEELGRRRDTLEPSDAEVQERTVSPRKGDITVDRVVLAWVPWWVTPDGIAEPAHA